MGYSGAGCRVCRVWWAPRSSAPERLSPAETVFVLQPVTRLKGSAYTMLHHNELNGGCRGGVGVRRALGLGVRGEAERARVAAPWPARLQPHLHGCSPTLPLPPSAATPPFSCPWPLPLPHAWPTPVLARSARPCSPVGPSPCFTLAALGRARSCPDRQAKTRVLKEMIFPNCERLGQTIIFVRTRDTAKALHAGESSTRKIRMHVIMRRAVSSPFWLATTLCSHSVNCPVP